MRVPLQVTREEDVWMARSPLVQGLLVTGDTLDELFNELPRVAQALYETCQEKGWTFIKGAPDTRPDEIVWVSEFPQEMLQIA